MKKLLPALLLFASCQKELIKEPLPAYAMIKIDLTTIRDSVLSTTYEYLAPDRHYGFNFLDGDKRAVRSASENVTIQTPAGELSSEGRPFTASVDTIQLNTYGYRQWDYKLVVNSSGFAANKKVRLVDQVTRFSYDITSYSLTDSKRFALAFNVTSPSESGENRFLIIVENKK